MESFKNLPNRSIPNFEISETPYTSEITRNKPTAFIFMIDQSESMKWDKVYHRGENKTKAEIVTEMINSTLNELVNRCIKADGIRNYFDVCLIGYGGESSFDSNVLWEGNLKDKTWVSISDIKENASFEKRQVVKNIRGITKIIEIDIPFWITPKANYQTPMLSAFKKAFELTKEWIERNSESFPPTIINITDGIYSDATKDEMMQEVLNLKALHTKDGNVLLLNSHISNDHSKSILFPNNVNEIPINESYAKDLFYMSSVMPFIYNRRISVEIKGENDIRGEYIGMAFNSNMDDLFRLIDIGTTQAK